MPFCIPPLVLNLPSIATSHVTEVQISETPIQKPITEEDLKPVGLLAERMPVDLLGTSREVLFHH